ncbi:hypothetical protein LCGC14_1813460, partial [marine sediment metagenome]
KQKPSPPENGKPPGPDEWDPKWITFNEKHQPVPAYGAPPDIEQRYAARQHRLISEYDQDRADLKAEILEEIKTFRQESETAIAQQQEQAEMNGVFEQHRNLFFIGGDHEAGLTGDGEKIKQFMEDKTWTARVPKEIDRLQMAVEFIQGQRPKTKPATAPRKAIRQPGVASAPAGQKTIVELIEEGKSLEQACVAANPD